MIAGLSFLLATVLVWLVVVGVCFLKGKARLGWLLVSVTALPVVIAAISLGAELWLSDATDPDHDKAVEVGWSLLIAAWLLFGTVTGLVALVAGLRAAKPNSWWAARRRTERPADPDAKDAARVDAHSSSR